MQQCILVAQAHVCMKFLNSPLIYIIKPAKVSNSLSFWPNLAPNYHAMPRQNLQTGNTAHNTAPILPLPSGCEGAVYIKLRQCPNQQGKETLPTIIVECRGLRTQVPELGLWDFGSAVLFQKSHLQANLTIKVAYFWARPVEIACPQSVSLDRTFLKIAFSITKTFKITTSAKFWWLLRTSSCMKYIFLASKKLFTICFFNLLWLILWPPAGPFLIMEY